MEKQNALFFTLLLFAVLALSAPAKVLETVGTISQATVYHGQALVTRQITVDLPKGSSEVVVTNLPAKIISESIYAESPDDTKVLSVRYRTGAVEADTREEVKKLDAEIETIERQIYHTEREKDHLDNQWSMFIKLRDFTAEATKTDTNRGILTFEPIKKLVEMIQEKGREYIDRTLTFEDKINDLKKELELLKRKRAELAAHRSKSEREAILYLDKSTAGKSTVELNYLVNGADWLCQYNLRGQPDQSNVLIEYNAVINQTSGEDWDAVKLSLSTAQSAMVASAPELKPLKIELVSAQVRQPSPVGIFQQGQPSFRDFKELRRARMEVARKGKAAEQQLQQIAVENQIMEFNTQRGRLIQMKEELKESRRVEGISVTYDLPGKLTMPSRSDRQVATIATIKTPADFIHLAAPLLTDYVYLQADLLNDSDIVFLPGEASVFRNGQFVGKSQMPAVTIGEKFTTGFGIDSQVQVIRELEDKNTKIQGGNRIDTFEYRTALENYRNEPVKLRLIDRLPYAEDKSIKIELEQTSHELSEDKQYVRKDKPEGLLRWDLELPANTTDNKATIVTYTYTAEYDKNMEVQPVSEN